MISCPTCRGPIASEDAGCHLCPSEGPGTELGKIIPWLFKPTSTCNCADLKLQMNRLGPILCKKHRERLVADLAAKKSLAAALIPHRAKVWKAGLWIDEANANSLADMPALMRTSRCPDCLATSVFCECQTPQLSRPTGKKQAAPAPPAKIAAEVREPKIPSPKSKLAICTVVIGAAAREYSRLTLPTFEAYADRVGADIVILDENQVEAWPIGNKFQVRYVGQQYERTLFLDSDVFVNDDSPNVFDLQSGVAWLHSDRRYLSPKAEDILTREITTLADGQGWKPPASPAVYNSGVVLFDREAADIWQPPTKPFFESYTAEQAAVECNLTRLGIETRGLDSRFNWQWYFRDFSARRSSAWFVHLANASHERRLQMLAELSAA